MMSTLMLPWFPTILASAVGARLVGHQRASWLGLACAIFWVILVQTATGRAIWDDAAMAAAVIAGSAAIVGMADWSARFGELNHVSESNIESHEDSEQDRSHLVGAVSEFDDWLESHRHIADIWPCFDEFLRHLLNHHCGARHVRTYRILSEGEVMLPLHALERGRLEDLPSARSGILGHVATTGRPYYIDDDHHGALVSKLAQQSPNPPIWCFAMRQGGRTIGLVSVRELDRNITRDSLHAMEAIVSQFWGMLAEVCRGRSAVTTDTGSGMMTREAFLNEANQIAKLSYTAGEPVTIVVIAMEGLRPLMDDGRWALCDEIVREVSTMIQHRVRPNDLIGRFDDARFMLLLRCVDSELASMIAYQISEQFSELTFEVSTSDKVHLRCGVSGSGVSRRTIAEMLSCAVHLCHQAREESVHLVSDVTQTVVPKEESAGPIGETVAPKGVDT